MFNIRKKISGFLERRREQKRKEEILKTYGCICFCWSCGQPLNDQQCDEIDKAVYRYTCSCNAESEFDFSYPVPMLTRRKSADGIHIWNHGGQNSWFHADMEKIH